MIKISKIIQTKKIIASVTLILSLISITGCHGRKEPQKINIYSHQEAEINQLKVRLSELEELIKGNPSNKNLKAIEGSISPIKSMTFRMESNDDRIRIYWEDGRTTDLPCTEEQGIWACG